MKKCPFCQAQNRDDTSVCFNCGRDLFSTGPTPDVSPTQPLRIRPVPQVQARTPPVQPVSPQGWTEQRYGVPQGQQPYPDRPSYDNQPYAEEPFDPAPNAAVEPSGRYRSLWPLLVGGLILLLAVIFGLAVFTLINAAAHGTAGLGSPAASPVGQVNAGAGSDNPTPLPTLAPTHAAQPSITPRAAPSQTPNPTQVSIIGKLLSPGCKSSLDQLSAISDQVKNDPLKVLDDTWRTALDKATADMKTNCGSLESASPIPGEIGQIQNSMNQANSEFAQAKVLWNQAIAQTDPGKAISAAQHVSQATQFLSEAISEIQNLVP